MAFTPTAEQQAVLAHQLGRHARILAGPGTGKSATVVALINRLLGQNPPPRVKLLTFTRAATAELARKVAEHPAVAAERPSTIHSFAISVLLQNPGTGGFPEPLRIADDWETKNIVHRTLAHRIGVRADRISYLFQELAANWECLEERESPRVDPVDRTRFLGGWNEHREIFGYTLLAELPYALRGALAEHADLRGINFDLIVVDEYQDLNACDLELLNRIAQRGTWIVGVGDDDQSIYSFRRAAPEGIRRFGQDYPGSLDYPLSVTHRCGPAIVNWARHVIEGDPDRDQARAPLTPRNGTIPGEVALLGFASETSEIRGIADLIQKLVAEERVPPAEILVLLRSDHNGAFSNPLKVELGRREISVTDPDAVLRVLSELGNRRLLALCRLITNRTDSLAWATLLNLEQGIGDGFLYRIYDEAREQRRTFGETLLQAAANNFPECTAMIRRRAERLVTATLNWLAAHPLPEDPPGAWGEWIIAAAPADGVQPNDEFRALLHSIDGAAEPDLDFSRYLNQITPLARDIASSQSDGVRIMSMASSKGLTVSTTIIPALEEGIIPRPDAQLAEERRLLYVAMTRSTRFVFGTYARRRQGPTARAGRAQVDQARRISSFLAGGPVEPEDGRMFLNRRFP